MNSDIWARWSYQSVRFWAYSFSILNLYSKQLQFILEITSLNLAQTRVHDLCANVHSFYGRRHWSEEKSLNMSHFWSDAWVDSSSLLYRRSCVDFIVISVEECWHWHELQQGQTQTNFVTEDVWVLNEFERWLSLHHELYFHDLEGIEKAWAFASKAPTFRRRKTWC